MRAFLVVFVTAVTSLAGLGAAEAQVNVGFSVNVGARVRKAPPAPRVYYALAPRVGWGTWVQGNWVWSNGGWVDGWILGP